MGILRMMCYSVMTQAYSEKEIPSSPNRSRTYDLPITSSDALPLNFMQTKKKINWFAFHHETFVGFTLQVVSSKHLAQVHLKI